MITDENLLIAINIALIGLVLGSGLLLLALFGIAKPSLPRDVLNRRDLP